MNSVYLIYENEISISNGYTFKEEFSLLRRLTPIQKVSVEIISVLKLNNKKIYESCFKNEEIQIYFATKYGEIKSVIKTSTFILKNELPVSPVSFQNSVHNCGVGIISIFHKLNMPHVVICCSKDPFMKAYELAYAKVKNAISDVVCILFSEESANLEDNNASSKMIIIGNDKFINKNKINYVRKINCELSNDK